MRIEQTETPSEADFQALFELLDEWGDRRIGRVEPIRKFALFVRDDAGAVIGGLWGMSYYDWMFIGQFFVPEEIRQAGLGSRLLGMAEAEAVARGCVGVWLDSFAFQAPGFYLKHGYREFGRIEDYPAGYARQFFLKRLDGGGAAGEKAGVVGRSAGG